VSGYRVVWYQAVTVTARQLIDAFGTEWEHAQGLGLNEDDFARESIDECDFLTLVDLGSNYVQNFECEPA
jgi:hypothetical protein